MNMNQNISEYIIDKGKSLLVDILDAATTNDYPLDWTAFADLPLPAGVTLTQSSDFSDLGINLDQMTHIVPTGGTSVNSTVLKKVNSLNAIWKQINKIRIGRDDQGIGRFN